MTLLLSATPFDPSDQDAIERVAESRGFDVLHPLRPGEPSSIPILHQVILEGDAPLEGLGINVAPPTDDSPYFFHTASPFAPVPAANAVQGATGMAFNLQSTVLLQLVMGIVSLLAVMLFAMPFLTFQGGRWGETNAHLARASVYFAAIGAAFMLIENMLLQHFVLFLGHPSYATTVIIASLLVGMGVGSSQANGIGLSRLQRYGLGVPLLLAALVTALPAFFAATLGLALSVRVVISCLVLVPLGAVLGLFFPLGMQRFGDNAKPWYWAMNGVFGVVASVMSLALSMEFGFRAVGLFAAAGYVVAWACLRDEP